MHRRNRSRTATYARGVCTALLVGSLAACSSGGHKTGTSTSTSSTSTTTAVAPTSSTLPTATSKLAMQHFFATKGKPILAFEQITTVFETGKAPTPQQCSAFLTNVTKVAKDQNTFTKLVETIPNPVLESAIKQETNLKLILGVGCGEAVKTHRAYPTTGKNALAFYGRLRAYSLGAHRILAEFGVSIF